jgi:glycosyltransferase involved in cell wall biosynthesis
MQPTVSLIIPCFNEEKYIGQVVECILRQDYPHSLIEALFVDGNSNDATRAILAGYSEREPFLRLLDNPRRRVPFAMNLGIANSTGEIVIRMDAHALYPDNYVSMLVRHLLELDADNVGGTWTSLPGNSTLTALAIAKASSSVFGVGNAFYRIGATRIQQVNTVPFGCYRRELFSRIGLFDEEMNRNQDDEFNARLATKGGRIFLVPGIEIIYFARSTAGQMIRMFFIDGLYKPLVMVKAGKPTTVRPFIPLFFVLFLGIFIPAGILLPALLPVLLAGTGAYVLANLWFSFRISRENRKPVLLLFLPCLFLFIHVSYGLGFLAGLFRLLARSVAGIFR